MKVLRVTCFADFGNEAQVEIVREDDTGYVSTFRFTFADANHLLDCAEKLRLVGMTMLRHAPRPIPEAR